MPKNIQTAQCAELFISTNRSAAATQKSSSVQNAPRVVSLNRGLSMLNRYGNLTRKEIFNDESGENTIAPCCHRYSALQFAATFAKLRSIGTLE